MPKISDQAYELQQGLWGLVLEHRQRLEAAGADQVAADRDVVGVLGVLAAGAFVCASGGAPDRAAWAGRMAGLLDVALADFQAQAGSLPAGAE